MATALLALIIIILLTVSAMRPVRSELSVFELDRRAAMGDREAKRILNRDGLLNDVVSAQRVIIALLLISVVLISVSTFGWVIGIVISVVMALLYGSIAGVGFIKSLARKLYPTFESVILKSIPKALYFFKLIRSVAPSDNVHDYRLGSSEDLRRLVDLSDDVLSSDDKKLIVHGLAFSKQIVSEIMTPRESISSIDKSEFLGPLALNDLHTVGHSRLPVIDGDIDHVVGVLNIQDMLTLDVKKSMSAEKAMEPGANYIRADQTLPKALAAFLNTHHHLFIVINTERETVGILSLNDVLEALLGRKIIDDYDTHDNLHAVASRKKA